MKIKVQDQVLVTTGKDKGKKGKIMRKNEKRSSVVVEKVNIRTKHMKKTAEQAGQIVKLEGAIHVSNIMLICPNCSKPTRIKYTKDKNNKKIRTCKKCNEQIDKKN